MIAKPSTSVCQDDFINALAEARPTIGQLCVLIARVMGSVLVVTKYTVRDNDIFTTKRKFTYLSKRRGCIK
jgi:hypothetical protein